jgi:hypothetical protein
MSGVLGGLLLRLGTHTFPVVWKHKRPRKYGDRLRCRFQWNYDIGATLEICIPPSPSAAQRRGAYAKAFIGGRNNILYVNSDKNFHSLA